MYRIIYSLFFLINKYRRSQSGATAIEYALIVGLIAAILVAAIGIFGERLHDLFDAVAAKLGEAADTVRDQPTETP